jgi:DNA (cytosine-5)-methyltransferase 1
MNVLDLFSGIGGFSLGLERAGMRTVAFCEINPYCRDVLRRHWPDVPIYDDVRSLTAERLAADGITVDGICGGFPCQDVSTVGARTGIDGARSGLWGDYFRLIRDLRPRFVIVENVTGLLDRGLDRVLGDLASIRFDAEWSVLSCCRLGATHARERVFLVAYPNEQRLEAGWPQGDGNGEASRPRPFRPEYVHQATLTVGRAYRDQIASQPAVAGVADGVPNRIQRNGALGNSVSPPVIETIGRAIMRACALSSPHGGSL